MESLSDYDQRQLSLILSKIEDYRLEKLELRFLIEDLMALLDALESVDENWKDSFRNMTASLDVLYSVAVYRGDSEVDDSEKKQILEKLDFLEELARTLLENRLK